MNKIDALLYFIMFIISYGMFFYLLLKTNFEKIFKKGRIAEIRVAYFIISFMLASIFSFAMVELVQVIRTIIIK